MNEKPEGQSSKRAKISLVGDSEYEILKKWWILQDFPVIPQESLPKETAFIVSQDGVPTVAGCLYLPRDEINMAWTTWYVANPDVSYDVKTEGFRLLHEYMYVVAHNEGIDTIFTFAGRNNLAERLEQVGFNPTEPGILMFTFLTTDKELADLEEEEGEE